MIFTDILSQGLYFCCGLFCGNMCGLVYDFLFVFRSVFIKGKVFLFIADIVFCGFSFGILFFFLYRVNGFDLKWYIIAAAVTGFFAERFFLKKPVAWLCVKTLYIFEFFKRFLRKLKMFFKRRQNDRKTASF